MIPDSHAPAPISGYMQDATHILPVRVYYEDTDFSGRVYHASYLRFFERGRTEFLRHAGFSHRKLASQPRPSGFSVVSVEAHFRAAAHIDDLLEIQTRLQTRQGPRFGFAQRLLREQSVISTALLQVVPVWMEGGVKRLNEAERSIWDKLLRPDSSFLKNKRP